MYICFDINEDINFRDAHYFICRIVSLTQSNLNHYFKAINLVIVTKGIIIVTHIDNIKLENGIYDNETCMFKTCPALITSTWNILVFRRPVLIDIHNI